MQDADIFYRNKDCDSGGPDQDGQEIAIEMVERPDGEDGENLHRILKGDLSFSIEEVPPWHMTIMLGFQHYLTMFGATIAVPLLLSVDLCMTDDPLAVGSIISTIFFVSGMATALQATFGSRLPIMQGGTLALLSPALSILRTEGACPDPLANNATIEDRAERTELWQSRMRLIQGAIITASVVEIVIGFTGIVGLLLRFIGPLTIAPTICLIGLSLFTSAANFAGQNWLLAIITVVLMIILSQYISKYPLPLPGFSSESNKCGIVWVPVFKLFPVILAVLFAWLIAAILTAANVFPEDSTARTDSRVHVLRDSPWFDFPYPFQWGIPTVTLSGALGMMAGITASMIESIGDYYACARISGAPPPPEHAMNRGIGIEGIGSLLAGIWGSGNGTTSHSENIGAIGITKVGSRRVVQVGAVVMIVLSVFAKFGAFFVTIPVPIIGGMFCALFGVIAAVGLSSLQYVDLNSSRNIFVVGFALFMGFVIPTYVKTTEDAINTRWELLNEIATVLLGTNMFVGGIIAAFLDNTMPGSKEERGIDKWNSLYGGNSSVENKELLKCYDFPFGMNWIREVQFFRFVPFCPSFVGWNFKRCCKRSERKHPKNFLRGVSNKMTDDLDMSKE